MLSIIIVNYKSEKKTIEYIQSELSKVTLKCIVVVVNNAATDESNIELVSGLGAELVYNIEYVADKNKQFYVIAHSDNLGYAKGNNLGSEFSLIHFKIKYFLFSNNDIRLIDNNVIEQLISKLSVLSNVGIIGPKIIGLDGENQSPEPYYPFWVRYFGRYWLQLFLPSKMKQSILKFDYSKNAKEGEHYKIMGSFFIVNSKDFVECGGMDSNTFLYSEEVILSERMMLINKKVYYYPELSVLHEHGTTISKNESIQKISKMMFESESYYYYKYRKTPRYLVFLGRLSNSLYSYLKK